MPLRPWILKLDRARSLIAELTSETDDYLKTSGVGLDDRLQLTEASPTWDIYLRLPSAIPPRWSPIIGDVLHNARSALDTYAFAVITEAMPDLTGDEHRKVMFPITDDPAEFDRGDWQRRLALPEQIVRGFRWAQPWADVEQAVAEGVTTEAELRQAVLMTPLRWLRELNNVDKHRTIHVAIAALDLQWAMLDGGSGEWITSQRSSKDGDLVGTFRIVEPGPTPPIFDGTIVVTMPLPGVSPPTTQPLGGQLGSMCSAVDRAIMLSEQGLRAP